jgi:predicted ribosome quality control (RQC) complex YloA/Tae2 family protein
MHDEKGANLDGLSITKGVNILKKRYEGNKVTKVTVTEDSMCIGVYSDERASVMVHITGGKPSLHTVFTHEGVGDQFLDRLNGGQITHIGCRKYDRVFYIDIEKRRPSGKLETNRLVFELIGKMANAFMLNEDGMIIWTFCKNNADADREMGIGKTYQMPRSNKSQTLEKYDTDNFADLLGFYPVTVKHAQRYIESNYSFAETAVLINESLEEGDTFYKDEAGRLIPFKPYDGGEEVAYDEICTLADAKESEKRDVSIRKRLSRFFEKQGEKYLRLKDNLTGELSEAGKHGEISRLAELLKGNIYKLKNVKGSVDLDEYTEEGVNVVKYDIPEAFDVNKEIEKLYKRADKLKRSIPLIQQRLAEVEDIVDSALEQLYFIEISADDDELRELALEMKKKSPKQQKRQVNQKQFEKMDIGGGTAYIGRNSVSNHRLVFQFANPNDWWFHAQKIPSAHLIFRKDGQVTEEEIEKCAAIVAGLSKAKNDLRVTVDYTQKKHVKKPKNTPPGFVIYHRFFSVTVEPEII